MYHNNHKYKPGHFVSDGSSKDFDSNIEDIQKLYFERLNSGTFWSASDQINFEGKWIGCLKRLIKVNNSQGLISIKLRLAEDEDGQQGQKEVNY